MVDPEAVFWPAVATIALGLLLVLISGAAFGRILADLEYQLAAGVNGVRRIQSRVNLRTHGNRVMIGVFALTIGIMGLTALSIVWQNWIAGVLFLVVLAVYCSSSVLDWLAERRQVHILLNERSHGEQDRTADLRADLESYRQMAETAVTNLEAAANELLIEQGKPPIEALAAVIPEHGSPVTPQQRETAEIATKRARLVAASRSLGLAPEAQPPEAAPEPKP